MGAEAATPPGPWPPVKCVVWDLDGTIWQGVAVELPPGERPRVLPAARRAIAILAGRGIVHSVASRTDPAVAAHLAADPDLAGRFVASQLGWGHKSEAVRRIAAELGIDLAAVVFVDDDPFERAEVATMLPAVRVFAPAELYARLDAPELSPPLVTDEARLRVARYRQEDRRRAAEQAADADREAFLRTCRMHLSVRPAGPGDLDRLAELVARTHRFNSTGAAWPRDRLAALVADAGWSVPVARLADRFGDYGLIGAALVERDRAQPRLHLLTVSCRAVGRGAPAALLRWLLEWARRGGGHRLRMDIRAHQTNLELRVLLRRSGFAAGGTAGELVRPLADPLPPPVPWLAVTEQAEPGDG